MQSQDEPGCNECGGEASASQQQSGQPTSRQPEVFVRPYNADSDGIPVPRMHLRDNSRTSPIALGRPLDAARVVVEAEDCDICVDRPERRGQRVAAHLPGYTKLPREWSPLSASISVADAVGVSQDFAALCSGPWFEQSGPQVKQSTRASQASTPTVRLGTRAEMADGMQLLNVAAEEPWMEEELLGETLIQTDEGCEERILIRKEEGADAPTAEEVEAVLRAIKANFAKLMKAGTTGWILVEFPNGEYHWYQWRGGPKIGCQGEITFRLMKSGPRIRNPGLTVIKIDSRGAGIGVEGPANDSDSTPPIAPQPPAAPPAGGLGGGPPPASPPPGGGLTWTPNLPSPRHTYENPVPSSDRRKYTNLPAVSPCQEVVFATIQVSFDPFVLATIPTREKPFRQRTVPNDAEMAQLFAAEIDAVGKELARYTHRFPSAAQLESAALDATTCVNPECPNVGNLVLDGWNLTVSNLRVETKYSTRRVGSAEDPRGYFVALELSIVAVASGEVWFHYECL